MNTIDKELIRIYISAIRFRTMFDSHQQNVVVHPAFLRIIALGDDVTSTLVSFLEEEEEEFHNSTGWIPIVALEQIHGENGAEIPFIERGNFGCLKKRWISWEKERQDARSS